MGCSQSTSPSHPNMFKARNLNNQVKAVNSVILEVQRSKVVVHSRSRKVMAMWPISCIRRYGCKRDLLFIEAGSGCDTGQGMYLFKCTRTEQIYKLLKRYWTEIQQQNEQVSSDPNLVSITTSNPAQTVITTVAGNQNRDYYNQTAANGDANYTNGCVRNYAGSSAPSTGHHTPNTPATRGSTSSQHVPSVGLPALLEEHTPGHTPLEGTTPFTLQAAPASRKEMLNRKRRVNSETVASYNRNSQRVTLESPQRRNSESANYENSVGVPVEQSGSFPRMTYDRKSEQVKLETVKTSRASESLRSPDVESVSRDVSTMSLKSDCEPLLTPGSNSTSGVGSMNGNNTTGLTSGPPPIPPLTAGVDPWKRNNFHTSRFQRRLSPSFVPQSACEYVNTVNVGKDVAGTPLPATASNIHFSFDFDHLYPNRSKSNGFYGTRSSELNYALVEVSTKSDDFNCGASSASSGIPGTPRTPKTPKTPSLKTTDYAIIDHKKTRALSNAHRARQRERKSRHGSTEVALLNPV